MYKNVRNVHFLMLNRMIRQSSFGCARIHVRLRFICGDKNKIRFQANKFPIRSIESV